MTEEPANEATHQDLVSRTRVLRTAPANPMPERPDERVCRLVLAGRLTVEDGVKCLSTSEKIAVLLAFGRQDLLPREYDDFRSAWRRLDDRQRRLVDASARARWKGKDEGGVC